MKRKVMEEIRLLSLRLFNPIERHKIGLGNRRRRKNTNGPSLALENGFCFLLENGKKLLLEK